MQKIIKYQKQIFFALVILVFANFLGSIYSNREQIFEKFDYKKWEDKYNKSQWIVPQSKNEISDDDLYIFVGSKLISGHDPSLINAEMPPLGKYLIGFSQATFGIIGFYGIFFSALSLILFFILNKLLFKSDLLAVIPVTLFSYELLFREQIGVSLLDAQYLAILFLTFILVLKERYLLAGISAGLFMATKSPFITIALYATILAYFLTIKKKVSLKNLTLMPVATLLTYVVVHAKYFFLGHSFIEFLKVQKYMINFYSTGAKGVLGAVFPMIFTGYWFTWFDKDGFIREWTVIWPIIFILSIFAAYKVFRKKNNDGLVLISIWLVLYIAFLVLTPIYSRYLLLALPFMYILSSWIISDWLRPHLKIS